MGWEPWSLAKGLRFSGYSGEVKNGEKNADSLQALKAILVVGCCD